MRGRSILVTGASGFVGHHLARRLNELGHVVMGAGSEAPSADSARGLEHYWRADIRDAETLHDVLGQARPTAIVHLAAQSSGAISIDRPIETFEINTLGTYALLDAVRRAAPQARVLVVGTGDVYGPQPRGTRASEEVPFHPVNPYALSKAAADTIAETASRLWGLEIIRTRSFQHVGPGQSPRFAIPSFVRQIAAIEAGRSEPVLRVGNLEVTRDVTDVRDVVEAYALLIERGRSGAAYNVCRGEGLELSEVVRFLCQRASVPVDVVVDPQLLRPAEVPYLVGDPSAIRAVTGWRPTRRIENAFEEMLEEARGRSRSGL